MTAKQKCTKDSEDPVLYLEIYFKLAYYFCVVPFKIEREQKQLSSSKTLFKKDGRGNFYLRKYPPQQILCYLLYTWAVYKFLPSAYATKFTSSRIFSFDVVSLFLSLGSQISFIYFMTMRQSDILAIANSVPVPESSNQRNETKCDSTMWKPKIILIIGVPIVASLVLAVLFTFFGINSVNLSDWSMKRVWSANWAHAKFNIFLNPSCGLVAFEEMTPEEHVGTILFVVLKCIGQMYYSVLDIGFFTMILLFHHLAREFQTLLQGPTLGWGEIQSEDIVDVDTNIKLASAAADYHVINKFWQLRHFIHNKVNIIYGKLMLWWMMECIIFYSCNLDSVFNETNRIRQLRISLYIAIFMVVLLLASDAHYKISGMKDWMIEKQRKKELYVPESELIVIMNVLSPCDVGIRASGFFTLTYDFVARIAHVIITYAVILLSFAAHTEKPLQFSGHSNIF